MSAEATSDSRPVPTLPGYEVTALRNSTSSSDVWEATQISLDRPVTIATLRPELLADPVAPAHFDELSRAFARLHHRNFVQVIDIGRSPDGIPFAVMENLDGSEPERAVTWLNLADLLAAEKRRKNGSELPEFTEDEEWTVSEYLETARDLLDGVPDADRGGNYAFVCEKCAPVFDWYGWFLYAKDLRRRAEEIRKS